MIVTLTDAEQRLAVYLAKRRHDHNRSAGTPNGRVGPQDDYTTDLEGIGAEIAFCRLVNVYPDLQLETRPIGDALLPDGRMVDVKSTRYASGRLLAVPGKVRHPADLYALMVGEFPTYRCAGLTTAAQLLSSDRLTDLGHGPVFAIGQSELTPPENAKGAAP